MGAHLVGVFWRNSFGISNMIDLPQEITGEGNLRDGTWGMEHIRHGIGVDYHKNSWNGFGFYKLDF
jgi:hypothetical protein